VRPHIFLPITERFVPISYLLDIGKWAEQRKPYKANSILELEPLISFAILEVSIAEHRNASMSATHTPMVSSGGISAINAFSGRASGPSPR
jgi:hypothetical protein